MSKPEGYDNWPEKTKREYDKETEKLERELAKGKGLISRFFDWLSEPKTIAGKSRQKQKEIDKRIDELLEKKFKG